MNIPSPSELKLLRQRYAPQRVIAKWTVIHLGKIVWENASPGLCEFYIKNNRLIGAYKKACYGK